MLFTYICPETKQPFPSLFKGAVIQSPFTGKWGSTLSNVKNGVSYENLSSIVNLFDLYTQYANCEGFGLPYVEAAACGVPVCGTDYSAMESEIRKLEGFPITPKALYKELETGCLRAVPDNDLAAEYFETFLSKSEEERTAEGQRTRENFVKHFQWHLSGKKWEDYFDSVELPDITNSWCAPPNIFQPAQKPELPPNANALDLSRFLITKVLGDPSRLNTFFEARLTRDLTYRSATSSTGGMYFNESSAAFDGLNTRSNFDFNIAYDNMVHQRNRINQWEQKRVEIMRQRGLMQ